MKNFRVKIWVGSTPSYIMVAANNSAAAISIARRLYPNARVVGTVS